jgi:hypothetical protein
MKRRTFLKYTCLGGVGAWLKLQGEVFGEIAGYLNPSAAETDVSMIAQVAPAVEIIRPADLLNLRFEFVNLKRVGGATLERIDAAKEAYVRIIFPPQHISEQAFNENNAVSPPPISSWIAGPSRLVFRLPKGMPSIPYTLSDLLSWGKLEPSLVPAAVEPSYKALDLEKFVLSSTPRVRIGGFAARLLPSMTGPAQSTIQDPFALEGPTVSTSTHAPIILPGPDQTALEAPRGLILSPHQLSAWAHSVSPFTHPERAGSGGDAPPAPVEPSPAISTARAVTSVNRPALSLPPERTELWHTRLGVQDRLSPGGVTEKTGPYSTIRAVHSPDYTDTVNAKNAACGDPNRTESLTPGERNQIVHLSADDRAVERRSVQARRLMLSPLGAWLDLRGDWVIPPGSDYSLESWTHRAVMGRDTFVRVVCKGYLFPFGHRASLITVTERRFEGGIAYLRFYQFIVVREPVRQYPKDATGTDTKSVEGRNLPFRAVRIKTLVSPHLYPEPKTSAANGWVMANGKDVLFQMEAEDWDGNISEFLAPLNFVENTVAESKWTSDPSSIQILTLITKFGKKYEKTPERRVSRLHGQKIAYAPGSQGSPGDTSFETDRLSFGFGICRDARKGDLLFFPEVISANVRLSAACQIAGKDTNVTIEPFQPFVKQGFGPGNDQGQVFAQIATSVPLVFSGNRSGGVATPTMNIRGLSRRFGIIGGPAGKDAKDDRWKQDLTALAAFDMTKSAPDPGTNYFSRFLEGAKLLGGISLGDIISLDFGNGKNIPKFRSTPEYDSKGNLVSILNTFEWRPSIKPFSAFVPAPGATFSLTSEIRQMLDGSEPSSLTSGVLTNFSITPLLGTGLDFVEIGIGSFSFTSRNGEKPDFDIKGLKFRFINALTFFNGLAAVLEAYQDNFSDPPSVNVTSDGVGIGYTLGLPPVTCGAFLMKNIAFSAGMTLPFNGPLALDLAFASRDNPFTLAVSIFGGGGFVGLGVGTTRLNYVEAALEGGVIAEMNFGPAKGSVYAMLGVYFIVKNETDGATVGISAYFRCGGAVSVLHLITVSIEIYLELTYQNSQLKGHGEIKVEVDVAFFSKTVTLSVDKSFSTAALDQDTPAYAGLPGMYGEPDNPHESYWAAYGAAFADTTGGAA